MLVACLLKWPVSGQRNGPGDEDAPLLPMVQVPPQSMPYLLKSGAIIIPKQVELMLCKRNNLLCNNTISTEFFSTAFIMLNNFKYYFWMWGTECTRGFHLDFNTSHIISKLVYMSWPEGALFPRSAGGVSGSLQGFSQQPRLMVCWWTVKSSMHCSMYPVTDSVHSSAHVCWPYVILNMFHSELSKPSCDDSLRIFWRRVFSRGSVCPGRSAMDR